MMANIQISSSVGFSPGSNVLADGARRPYCRVEENVTQMIWCSSSSFWMNGAHLGYELVRTVLPLSATPGLFALVSAIGVAPPSEVRNIVAVGSVSASHDLSAGCPKVGVPFVQVDSS